MKPDVECYSAAIKALCNSGQHADGLWMLHEVEGMQLRPDERVYEAIILSCSELGEWERALVFLDYMAQIGFSPNAFCFINAMQACANCGQWEQVLHLFDEMQESAIRRPVRAFSLSLDVCQASGKWERALLIFDEFISKGGILEEDLVEPLVKACLAAKQGPRVRQLLMLGNLQHDLYILRRTSTCCCNMSTCQKLPDAKDAMGQAWFSAQLCTEQIRG